MLHPTLEQVVHLVLHISPAARGNARSVERISASGLIALLFASKEVAVTMYLTEIVLETRTAGAEAMATMTLSPERDEHSEARPLSSGSVAILGGGGLTAWATEGCVDTAGELQLTPDRPVIIGRQEGGEIEYLDPAYRPTQVVPETGQSVVTEPGHGADTYVSRGHFMLRGSAGGILLVNGVPRRGGGIRPPLNGTWLVGPVRRSMEPGEEYLIEHGASIVLWLPNKCMVRISAA